MADDKNDKDTFASGGLQSPQSPGTNSPGGLPGIGEADVSPTEQRRRLEEQLRQLEGAFRYMGKAHPRYQATLTRLQQLRWMIDRLRDA